MLDTVFPGFGKTFWFILNFCFNSKKNSYLPNFIIYFHLLNSAHDQAYCTTGPVESPI